MMFENNLLSIDHIPKYQDVELSDLHKDYKKLVILNTLLTIMIGLAICCLLFFTIDDNEKFYAIIPVFLGTIWLAVFSLLVYKKKKYAFRQHDVIFKKGLIVQTTHITPYIRLQHVVIKQGWYAKKLGLATLAIYTAANNFSDISIPGLTLAEAERWKSFLLNRIQELNDESES